MFYIVLFLLTSFQAAGPEIPVGDQLYSAGRYREAAEHFEKLLQSFPDDVELLVRLGACQYALEEFSQAEKTYRRVLALSPARLEALLGLGATLTALDRSHEAAVHLEKGVGLAPENPVLRKTLARAYWRGSRFYEAEDLLRRLVREHPEDGESWCYLGALLYDRNYHNAALEALEQCLRLQPENLRAQVYHAGALAGLGRRSEAEAAFGRLLENPSAADPEFFFSYAQFLFLGGQAEAALPWMDRAITALPRSAKLYFWRARISFQLGRLEKAAADAEKAVELSPGLPNARNLLLKIYQLLGRSEEAARYADWLREYQKKLAGRGAP